MSRRRAVDPLAELLADTAAWWDAQAADTAAWWAEAFADLPGDLLADFAEVPDLPASPFAAPWVRYACACGYIRETLDAGEAVAPCARCGRPVRAERRHDDGQAET